MDILSTVIRTMDDAFEIGRSVGGRPILAAHVGSRSGRQVIVTAAIHARECYTALCVLAQYARLKDAEMPGGAYLIPLVNPDGAAFFESGLYGKKFDASTLPVLRDKLADRLVWKANGRGVDLNCNFDARFGAGSQQHRNGPSAFGYTGERPLSEPETKALADFTEHIGPAATVSYHCMGGELYWEFGQTGERRARDERLATRLAKYLGVRRVDGDLASAGGYKDWCVQSLHIPAFTVEVIDRGAHPFRPQAFGAAAARGRALPAFLLSIIGEENGSIRS